MTAFKATLQNKHKGLNQILNTIKIAYHVITATIFLNTNMTIWTLQGNKIFKICAFCRNRLTSLVLAVI